MSPSAECLRIVTVIDVVDYLSIMGDVHLVDKLKTGSQLTSTWVGVLTPFKDTDMTEEQKHQRRDLDFDGDVWQIFFTCHDGKQICSACKGSHISSKCPLKGKCLTCFSTEHKARDCPGAADAAEPEVRRHASPQRHCTSASLPNLTIAKISDEDEDQNSQCISPQASSHESSSSPDEDDYQYEDEDEDPTENANVSNFSDKDPASEYYYYDPIPIEVLNHDPIMLVVEDAVLCDGDDVLLSNSGPSVKKCATCNANLMTRNADNEQQWYAWPLDSFLKSHTLMKYQGQDIYQLVHTTFSKPP